MTAWREPGRFHFAFEQSCQGVNSALRLPVAVKIRADPFRVTFVADPITSGGALVFHWPVTGLYA